MRVVGYGCHAPDEVMVRLNKEQGVKRKQCLFVAADSLLPVKRPRNIQYVVFFSVRDARRNLRCDASYASTVFIIFDDPITLSGYSVTPMDFRIGDDVHIDGFKATEIRTEFPVEDNPFTRVNFDILTASVEEVKAQRTILNQLMTFIYTLPRATHQGPIKVLVCNWMGSRNTLAKLNADIGRMKNSPLNPKQLARLNGILSSETATIYREAMREGGDSAMLAHRYGISAYEINYMRAIVAQKS